jgi:hypothetical protein
MHKIRNWLRSLTSLNPKAERLERVLGITSTSMALQRYNDDPIAVLTSIINTVLRAYPAALVGFELDDHIATSIWRMSGGGYVISRNLLVWLDGLDAELIARRLCNTLEEQGFRCYGLSFRQKRSCDMRPYAEVAATWDAALHWTLESAAP